ncbi:MAG: carbohydrate porin [Gluconacetobacter sp.]
MYARIFPIILIIMIVFIISTSTNAGLAADLQSGILPNIATDTGNALISSGIYPKAFFDDTLYANAAGGVRREAIVFHEAYFGADLDMNRIAGLSGTIVRFAADSRFGGNPQGVNDMAGSGVSYFHGSGPNNQTRLTQLEIEEHLADDRLRVSVGRMQLSSFFATSRYYCLFQLGMCANLNPMTWSSNSDAPFWPVSVWAGEMTVIPRRNTYLRFGGEESNSTQYYNGGFPWGHGWSLHGASGAHVMIEAGYETADSSHLPGRYDVGAYEDTSPVASFRYDTNGGRIAFTHGAPRMQSGQNGVYAQFEQTVWHPRRGHQLLTLLGGLVFDTSGRSLQKNYFLLGFIWDGLFPGRRHDFLAFKATEHHLNRNATDYLDDEIVASGRSGRMSTHEQTLEADYSIRLVAGVRLTPFAAFIFHPDQQVYTITQPDPKITHSFSGGLQLSFSLGEAADLTPFGLSRPY